MHQAALSTQATTKTQDELLLCIRKLQQPGTAHTPASLIKRIPHLIRYKTGDSADAHELLIALINDVSVPLAQIFQGQMSSTVQCSHCNNLTTTTDNMQDISLHIATDSSSPLPERLYDFFQPETLEGENAFWCDDCQKSRRATKTLSYTHIPTILIVHLKRLILGEKI
jgi:ubiquitin C-terminal hydrolase